jgi:hypothetical protein
VGTGVRGRGAEELATARTDGADYQWQGVDEEAGIGVVAAGAVEGTLDRKMGWELNPDQRGEVVEPRATGAGAGADDTKIVWLGLGLGGLKSYTAASWMGR